MWIARCVVVGAILTIGLICRCDAVDMPFGADAIPSLASGVVSAQGAIVVVRPLERSVNTELSDISRRSIENRSVVAVYKSTIDNILFDFSGELKEGMELGFVESLQTGRPGENLGPIKDNLLVVFLVPLDVAMRARLEMSEVTSRPRYKIATSSFGIVSASGSSEERIPAIKNYLDALLDREGSQKRLDWAESYSDSSDRLLRRSAAIELTYQDPNNTKVIEVCRRILASQKDLVAKDSGRIAISVLDKSIKGEAREVLKKYAFDPPKLQTPRPGTGRVGGQGRESFEVRLKLIAAEAMGRFNRGKADLEEVAGQDDEDGHRARVALDVIKRAEGSSKKIIKLNQEDLARIRTEIEQSTATLERYLKKLDDVEFSDAFADFMGELLGDQKISDLSKNAIIESLRIRPGTKAIDLLSTTALDDSLSEDVRVGALLVIGSYLGNSDFDREKIIEALNKLEKKIEVPKLQAMAKALQQ